MRSVKCKILALQGDSFPHTVRLFQTHNTRSFHIAGNMEGNSCWSKPILESCVFAKGRVNFDHNSGAGTGRALPDDDVEMAQQVSAENQVLVFCRLTEGWTGRWGWAAEMGQAGVCRSNPAGVQMGRLGPRGGDNPPALCTELSLAPGSSPFQGSFPFLNWMIPCSSLPSELCCHLENLSQRKERFCLFV